MKRGNLFWGGILLLLGFLFFLQAQKIITDPLGWFFPLFLMLLGGWVILQRYLSPTLAEERTFSLALQNASKISLELEHGGGMVKMSGGAPQGVALQGTQGGTLEVKSHQSEEELAITLSAGPSVLPFIGTENGYWNLALTEEVPVSVKVETGASNTEMDFTNVQLAFLGIEMGAARLSLKLPAQAGRTLVDIESGAANIEISVPQGVGARLRLEQGASSQNIDTARFPALPGGYYQSADFETATNRVEVNLEGGANNINIR